MAQRPKRLPRLPYNDIWMDMDGVCEYLKFSKEAAYKMAQRGTIPAHKLGGMWRFNRYEIDRWLKAQ